MFLAVNEFGFPAVFVPTWLIIWPFVAPVEIYQVYQAFVGVVPAGICVVWNKYAWIGFP